MLPALEQLLPKTGGSLYGLINMAAVRAAELADGKKPLIEAKRFEKETTVALKEIAYGKISLKRE